MRETIGEALYFQYYLARNFSLEVGLAHARNVPLA